MGKDSLRGLGPAAASRLIARCPTSAHSFAHDAYMHTHTLIQTGIHVQSYMTFAMNSDRTDVARQAHKYRYSRAMPETMTLLEETNDSYIVHRVVAAPAASAALPADFGGTGGAHTHTASSPRRCPCGPQGANSAAALATEYRF